MYLLTRICLHNWNLLDAKDIEITGATGMIGPTGVGKSTVLDAIQTVIAGGNTRAVDLNASTDGKSDRSIHEYCLGYLDDIGPDPIRPRCESTVALVFRDEATGQAITIGLMFHADKEDSREQLTCRFIAKGLAFRVRDFTVTDQNGQEYPLSHAVMIERMRSDRRCRFEQYNTSATKYVEAYLSAMRGRQAAPSARHFLNNFKNMVAFRPVDDATSFVRRYVLAPDPLDVNRIRDSIDHWRRMEAEVQRLQAMLHAIQQVRGRFTTWGRQKVHHNALTFTEAYSERLRLQRLRARAQDKLSKAQTELERLRAAATHHTNAIDKIDEEIRQKNLLLSQSGESAKVEAIRERQRSAETALQDAQKALAKRVRIAADLAQLERVKQYIPMSLHGAVASAQSLTRLAQEDAAALARREGEIDELEQQAFGLIRARDALRQNSDNLAAEISTKSQQIEDLEAQVSSAGDTGAVLSGPVRQYIEILSRAGIQATPLPDLVEVKDPRWAFALESVLGPNREALIVDAHHQDKALQLLYENRHKGSGLHTCRLVQMRRMDRVNATAEADSLATLVEPTGAYADTVRTFIDHHVGRIRMVETQRELDQHSHAITPEGKMAAGLTLRVQKDLTPILGKTARNQALEETRQRISQLKDERSELVDQKKRIDSALDALRRVEDTDAPELTDCLQAIQDANARISSAKSDLQTVEDPQARQLQDEIARLEADRTGYKQELADEIKPEIDTHEKAEQKHTVEVQTNDSKIADQRKREQEAIDAEAEMANLITQLDEVDDIADARSKVEAALLRAGDQNAEARLAELRIEAHNNARSLFGQMRDNERRAQNGFHKFLKDYDIASPLGEDADNVAMLSWLVLREHKLEQNELRPHKEEVEKARESMEYALKEDLLNKLSDKFKQLKSQLRVLNKRLEDHKFVGMRYHFAERVDPRLSRLHALAERISGSPEQGLETQTESGSTAFREAMEQIEEILDKTSDTAFLEDYRNYYTFELIMRGADGVETNLSRRTRKGSGGQKQAPYYVAIAAAMASVYYPGSRNDTPDGMGLVVFDEAFNRLDIPNTQAILRFYKALNLQVVVAAPEEKRMSFLEVMDTIVSVNKLPGDDVMQIDTENPGERAVREMQAANPEHIGVEGYRRAQEARSDAGRAPARNAAE